MKLIKSKADIKGNRLTSIFWLTISALLLFSFTLVLLFYSPNDVIQFRFDNRLSSPNVDKTSGYFTVAPTIKLSCSDSSLSIYYTLDGTPPYNSNATRYTGIPIQLNAGKEKDTFLFSIPTSPHWQPPIGNTFSFPVLRAVCVDKNGKRGNELVESYVIDPSGMHQYRLPFASIVFNPDDLFGYEKGIYIMGKNYEDKDNYIKKRIRFDIPWWKYPANYLSKGEGSERPVVINIIDEKQKCQSSLKGNIRIHGFNTRGFAQKSIRFQPNSSLHNHECIKLFNNFDSGQAFVFRNGGNDWTKTLIRDAFIHDVMSNSHSLSPQAYQPVVCFFNGEYWGIHTLRERFDEYYIQNKNKVRKDSITILELDGQLIHGKKSEAAAFTSLMNFILKSDLSKPENYAVVEKEIDLENLIEYYLLNLFFVNNDWPHNNFKYWRYSYSPMDTLYRDNKWRFVLYDMDWSMGFNIEKAYSFNMFEYLETKKAGTIFYKLIKNDDFRKLLISKAESLMNNELTSNNLKLVLRKHVVSLESGIPDHANRWRVIASLNDWKDNVTVLSTFIEKRPALFVSQLNDYFNLSESEKIILK